MKLTKHSHTFAVFGLIYGAIAWGIIWYPYRLLADTGIGGVLGSFYTYGLALLIAAVVYAKQWRQLLSPWPPNMFYLAIAAGVTNITYILAVLDGEIVRVMLLFYLSPIWTVILAHFWLKERTNLRGLMVILLALLGAFIMLFDFDNSNDAWYQQLPIPQNSAEWFALVAGMGFALSNVITRKAQRLSLVHKSFAVWVGVMLLSGILLLFIPNQSPPILITANQAWLTFIIALVLITATLLVQFGVTRIPATRAALIFLIELFVAAIAAYYLADETMTWNEWFGGVLIMLASVLPVKQMKVNAQ